MKKTLMLCAMFVACAACGYDTNETTVYDTTINRPIVVRVVNNDSDPGAADAGVNQPADAGDNDADDAGTPDAGEGVCPVHGRGHGRCHKD